MRNSPERGGFEHPRAVPGLDDGPFHEGVRRGELLLQCCDDCHHFRHYPRPVCPRCLSRSYSWKPSSGRGTVYTWTVVRGPTLPVFGEKVPYNVVDVLLDEGVHFVSEVVDCPPEVLRAGLPVEAFFSSVDEGLTLVKFRCVP